MKKLQFGLTLYIISGPQADYVAECSNASSSSPTLYATLTQCYFRFGCVKKPLRDVTITAVTGSSVVEQERKQEVNTTEPQVVFRRPAYSTGGCLICCGCEIWSI